jgi:hypothetical protein
LRVLPTEIYDKDRAIFDSRLRMELKDLSVSRAGN